MRITKYIWAIVFLLCVHLSYAQKSAIVKPLIKKVKSEAIEQGIKKAAREGVEKSVKKNAIKTTGKGARNRLVGSKLNNTVQSKLSSEGSTLLKHNAKKLNVSPKVNKIAEVSNVKSNPVVPKTTNKGSVDFKSLAKSELEQAERLRVVQQTFMNNPALSKFESNPKLTNTLIQDIAKNPELEGLFKKNPETLSAWKNSFGSEKRTDVRLLTTYNPQNNRHLKLETDIAKSKKGNRRLKNKEEKHGRVEDVKAVDIDKKTYLADIKTNEKLAEYTVENDLAVVNVNNPKLLDLPPMPNTIYKYDGSAWKTDKLGRLSETTVPFSKSNNTGTRDPENVSFASHNKNYISGIDFSKINDDGGHLVPQRMGGTCRAINILPQNKKLNNGPIKALEKKLYDLNKKGHKVELKISTIYPNAHTHRPKTYVYEYTVDGKSFKEIFHNKIEYK